MYRDASGNWVYEAAYVDRRASEQLLAQREREVERGEVGHRSEGVGTLGENMQEAAAQRNGLGLVAGAGFEPAIFRL